MPNSREDIGKKERLRNPFEILLKMRREAPEFRRCCLCLPLRRGLITWGYVKLALNMTAIALIIYILAAFKIFIPIFLIETFFLFTDAVFSIILIVGGHRKNVKILKAAYIYNIVWLCLLLLSGAWSITEELRLALGLLSVGVRYVSIVWMALPGLCVHFILIFVQIYLILLIRSENLKLEEQSMQMQFTNPSAAEAQCTMHVPSVGGTDATCQRPDRESTMSNNG